MFYLLIIAPTILLFEWIYKSIYWIVGIFGVVIFIVYIISVVRVVLIERKIKNLEDERDDKIQKENNAIGVQKSIVERKIAYIKAEYEPKLVRLRRDRQFILDKLPLIKK